jgi:hypothetical protein
MFLVCIPMLESHGMAYLVKLANCSTAGQEVQMQVQLVVCCGDRGA